MSVRKTARPPETPATSTRHSPMPSLPAPPLLESRPPSDRQRVGHPPRLTPQHIFHLQRTVGNRAVLQLLAGKAVRPSPPNTEPRGTTAAPPVQSGRGDVLQRVIPGLESIRTIADIEDQWVDLYIADVLHASSHLYDEDIMAYLDAVQADWRNDASMVNTGGNHWDVILTRGNQQITVGTTPDGNCGVHAIHAVLSRQKFKRSRDDHSAPQGFITHVRRFVQNRIRQDRQEIKARLLLEIQRNFTAVLTGFGPQLVGALRQIELQAHLKMAERPSASAASNGKTGFAPVSVGPDRFARFRRLLTEQVPLKIVTTMMRDEKLAENEIQEFVSQWRGKNKEEPSREEPSASHASLDEREVVRQKVLQLEHDLMDLIDFEMTEQQFLEDFKKALFTHHQPQLQALQEARTRLKQARDTQTDVEAAQQEVQALNDAWQVTNQNLNKEYQAYVKRSQKKIAHHQHYMQEIVTEKRIEWMGLMEQLCGTHTVKGHSGSGSKGLVGRHDAQPGVYGRTPTPDDSHVSHRQVEVLHGHGGWYRTGMVSEAILSQEMPGLTSLSEIVERANVIRRGKAVMEIPLDQVDLAFVDHHGTTIMNDRVIRGAYPQLMAIPLDLHKQVVALMEEARAKAQDPDTYIKSQCTRILPNSTPIKRRNPKYDYPPQTQWINPALWDAYQRVKEGTASGKSAEYVDIISGKEHPAVKFPNSRIQDLRGVDAGEKGMRAIKVPNYTISTTDNLANSTLIPWSVSAWLSDAIVDRLSQIRVDQRPIRIIWAACRSEQWHSSFTDKEFLAWIERAAALRRNAPPE